VGDARLGESIDKLYLGPQRYGLLLVLQAIAWPDLDDACVVCLVWPRRAKASEELTPQQRETRGYATHCAGLKLTEAEGKSWILVKITWNCPRGRQCGGYIIPPWQPWWMEEVCRDARSRKHVPSSEPAKWARAGKLYTALHGESCESTL
jgi:hypothetical protein